MPSIRHYSVICIILILFIFGSCKPVIYTFTVSPLIIIGDQKLHIDLDIKGKPSLYFSEHLSTDSVQLLEYTLIVTRAGKVVRKTVQVQKLRSQTTIDIAFATNKLEGDIIVASGENNNQQWNKFQVVSVSSHMSRNLTITHSGRTVTLQADGSSSLDLSGTTAGGEWWLRTRLTENEKADFSKLPQELKIRAVIKPLNP